MTDLKEYDGPDKIITSWDKLDELHAKMQFQPTVKMDFGIEVIDEETRGMKGGDLVLFAGDEGEGKTTLARTVIKNIADQEKRTLVFSCEERPDELLRKFEDQIPYFLWPAEMDEASISWLKERYEEAKAKYGDIHSIVVDHLLYVTDGYKSGSQEQDIWRCCRALKSWARKDNVAIIIIHHTNRSESQDEPSQRSLYGSGGPGKESDTCMYIWRHDNSNTATVKITKCRETGAKNVKVIVEKKGPFLYSFRQKEPHQMHELKIKNRRYGDD